MAVSTVAKQPKKPAGKIPAAPEKVDPGAGKAETASNTVRLKPVFQKRLKRVAESHKMNIGEFIEHHLGEMVNREFREIVERELAELREQAEEE